MSSSSWRMLHPSTGRDVLLTAHCTCGTDYIVGSRDVDLAHCPTKRCQRPASELPADQFAVSG